MTFRDYLFIAGAALAGFAFVVTALALAEVVGTRDCSPCGYRIEFDAALASEIWLVCDGRCVMWSRL